MKQSIQKSNKQMLLNKTIEIILDPKIYPLEAIYLTSYNFSDKAYIFLDSNSKNNIIVKLKLKPNVLDNFKDIKTLEGEFYNELMNNTLRYQISQENKNLREFIIGTALLGSLNKLKPSDEFFKDVESVKKELEESDNVLIQESQEDSSLSDTFDDVLGIAIPWEEKFGQTNKKNTSKKKK